MSAKNMVDAIKFVNGQAQTTSEFLTDEAALQIKINDKPYTITMRSPSCDDKLLAVGLLFTEGIIKNVEDVLAIDEIPTIHNDSALSINVSVKEDLLAGKNLFNRSIASSASCGVCGKIKLCDLVNPTEVISSKHKLDILRIPAMLMAMKDKQASFKTTGGSHAAAIFTSEGEILSIKEDIGRHNAVDKTIGDTLLKKQLLLAHTLFVSGRVSYEIVAKCSQAKIPFLLAVSAPSSLAVQLCNKTGITLIAFCRENRATVYTHSENINTEVLMLDEY
jgi:FdhD protein